jgi:hypothetical protein
MRFRALDWGFHAPSAVLWIAVSDGMIPGIPEGAFVIYREHYRSGATAEELAKTIVLMTSEKVMYSVCDPNMYPQKAKVVAGPSISEVFALNGCPLVAGDNARDAGWQQVRQRLTREGDVPMMYIFDTCRDLIRTLPLAQHDDKKPEDLDTTGEDHLLDALRYGCMSRPFTTRQRVEQVRKAVMVGRQSTVTMDDLWHERESSY